MEYLYLGGMIRFVMLVMTSITYFLWYRKNQQFVLKYLKSKKSKNLFKSACENMFCMI